MVTLGVNPIQYKTYCFLYEGVDPDNSVERVSNSPMVGSWNNLTCKLKHKKSNTLNKCIALCTEGEARTPDTWFWRPVLYQLSYFRIAGAKVVFCFEYARLFEKK